MGDSVPKHTGPISLTDTHLEPSVLRTRPTTTRENRRRWKGLIPRDHQAACRCNCLASNSAADGGERRAASQLKTLSSVMTEAQIKRASGAAENLKISKYTASEDGRSDSVRISFLPPR